LIQTPLGLQYTSTLTGLVTNQAEQITVRVVAADAASTIFSTTQILGVVADSVDLGLTPFATGTIVNDDAVISLAATAAVKSEGQGGTMAFIFTATRTGDTSVAHTVSYALTGTGANPANGADFAGSALPAATVTFAVGETSKAIIADVAGDTVGEADETFMVSLSAPTVGASLGTANASGTIVNDDTARVSIAPLSASKAEGNAGTTTFTFTVSLDQAGVTSQSVGWAVTGSGANPAAVSDFGVSLPTGSVTFAAGETSRTVTVLVSGDTAVEPDEGFTVTLSNASSGLVLGTASAAGMIQNDDTAIVSIAALSASKAEGNSGTTAFTFTVSLDQAGVTSQSVGWAVTGSGANPATASDFGVSLPTGSVTFAVGETSRTVTVLASGDTAVEPDEGFTVTLSNASSGLVRGAASATGTIQNDDVAVAVTAHDDAYVIQRGQSLTLATSVLSNDDGATSASLLAGPTHGALQLAANGTFGYTPAVGFFGVDSFTYRAANGGGADDGQALVYVVPVQVGASTTLDLLALTAEEQIAATYVAFFSRAADAAGFDFWVDQFVTGLPVQGPAALFANIASSFGISNEAKALYPFLANPFGASDGQIATFLNSVYDNLFNRGSDAAGLAYWTGQIRQTLDSGQFVGSVLVNIMSGAQDSAASKDITTLMGKVAVSLEFVHEQQGHNTIWAGAGDIAAATTLLEPVTSDPLSVLIGVRNAGMLISAHP